MSSCHFRPAASVSGQNSRGPTGTPQPRPSLGDGPALTADGEGFEPPLDLRPKRFSRPSPSTTRPPIRCNELLRSLAAFSHASQPPGARCSHRPMRPEATAAGCRSHDTAARHLQRLPTTRPETASVRIGGQSATRDPRASVAQTWTRVIGPKRVLRFVHHGDQRHGGAQRAEPPA